VNCHSSKTSFPRIFSKEIGRAGLQRGFDIEQPWYVQLILVQTRYPLTSITQHIEGSCLELIEITCFSEVDRCLDTDRRLKPSGAPLLGLDKSRYYRLIHCHWQVLCWGVRNMKKFELTSVTSPSIEFECAGEVVQSDVIKDTKKNPNFEKPVLTRMIAVIIPIFILST